MLGHDTEAEETQGLLHVVARFLIRTYRSMVEKKKEKRQDGSQSSKCSRDKQRFELTSDQKTEKKSIGESLRPGNKKHKKYIEK